MESQVSQIRAELKQWEREFSAAHNGRKAGREDIKKNPEIAKKYKNYDKIRRTLAAVSKISEPESTRSTKRSSSVRDAQDAAETPCKRVKTIQQPLQPWNIDPYDPPLSTLFSPSKARTTLGPTPQKDGKVLGLFDGLSSGSAVKTPSRRKALAQISQNEQITPSKPQHEAKPGDNALSVPRPVALQSFLAAATPSKNRVAYILSPGSTKDVSKSAADDTPAFLRRASQILRPPSQSQMDLGDDAFSWSPIAVRKLAVPAGRGLSALVKDLREMEDKHLDDDLDMLREMEDNGGIRKDNKNTPAILIQDSQGPEMPLGPDRGEETDEDEGETINDTQEFKPRKKKGQKRTTRRVTMKPNTAKWKPEPKWQADAHDEGGNEQDLTTGIPEGEQERQDSFSRGAESLPKTAEDKNGPNQIQKLKKKISATAHANFRALKIKNKNSKGKRGRFGRKR